MSKFVELEVKPEGASGQVLAIPLSSTGGDGKAKTYEVRDEKGSTLLKVDSVTSQVRLSPLSFPITLPVYADSGARDAAIATPSTGMLIFNVSDGAVQVYTGGLWANLATV